MAPLYGQAGRLTALFGGFRPGQDERQHLRQGGAGPARRAGRRAVVAQRAGAEPQQPVRARGC
jgi:hypothetical protein